MRLIKRTLRLMLPISVVLTMLSALLYVVVQQVYRASANDPQVQIAHDAAQMLEAGVMPASLISSTTTDIGRSLGTYMLLFDDNGSPVAGSGLLNAKLPVLPRGVFDYARQHGENRITWQPEPGIRQAIVVERVNGANAGFIVAGRSLRETEQRIDQLTLMVGVGWAAMITVTILVIMVTEIVFRE